MALHRIFTNDYPAPVQGSRAKIDRNSAFEHATRGTVQRLKAREGIRRICCRVKKLSTSIVDADDCPGGLIECYFNVKFPNLV